MHFVELGFEANVESAAAGFENRSALREGGVFYQGNFRATRSGVEEAAHGGGVNGADAEAVDLLEAEFFETDLDKGGHGFGVNGEFAVKNAAGDGDGEFDDIGFAFAEELLALGTDEGGGTGEVFDGFVNLLFEAVPCGRFAFAEAGLVLLAGMFNGLGELLFELADAVFGGLEAGLPAGGFLLPDAFEVDVGLGGRRTVGH